MSVICQLSQCYSLQVEKEIANIKRSVIEVPRKGRQVWEIDFTIFWQILFSVQTKQFYIAFPMSHFKKFTREILFGPSGIFKACTKITDRDIFVHIFVTGTQEPVQHPIPQSDFYPKMPSEISEKRQMSHTFVNLSTFLPHHILCLHNTHEHLIQHPIPSLTAHVYYKVKNK